MGRVALATGENHNNGTLYLKLNNTVIQNHVGIVNWWSPWTGAKNFFHHGYILGWANSGYAALTDIHVTRVRIASTEALADPDLSTGW